MLVFHLGIIVLTISFVHSAPIENPTEDLEVVEEEEEEEEGDPICKGTYYWDETGYLCNANRTGYHYCDFLSELVKSVSCPSGKRCNCGGDNKCYVVSLDETPATDENDVCEVIPPIQRPLPDPAIFTYRGVYKSEWESQEGPDYTVNRTWSGEVRQDINNGKYMTINHENSHFHMVLEKTAYTGNLEERTCHRSRTSTPGPYWSVDKFLGSYTFYGGETVQTWRKPGMSQYEAVEYFWVSVKDGFTLLGRYSVSEGRDWEDESMMLSRDENVYYNTTYGVDSTRWFDIPRFCLKR